MLLFWLHVAHADDLIDAAINFQIPTMQAKQLSVQGQDLLQLAGSGRTLTDLNVHVGSTYSKLNQSPMITSVVYNDVNINGVSASNANGENVLEVALTENIRGEIQKYYDDERGVFVRAGGDLESTKNATAELSSDFTFELSAGYGRIVDARTVAQAQAACEALLKLCDVNTLTNIAELIGQREQFVIDYRFEADKYFYAALADELGGLQADDLFELRQVLESPLYNIGSRRVGWTASLGTLRTTTGIGTEAVSRGDLPIIQKAGYATLLDSSTGFLISNELIISQFIDDAAAADFSLAASINRDHSYQWRSQLDAGLETTLGQNNGVLFIEGVSDFAFGTNMVCSSSLSLDRALSPESKFGWELSSSFTYYVF